MRGRGLGRVVGNGSLVTAGSDLHHEYARAARDGVSTDRRRVPSDERGAPACGQRRP